MSAGPHARDTWSDDPPLPLAGPSSLFGIVVVAAVYFAAAKLGLSLAFVAEQVTAVWPPTGIALAVLFVAGPRLWPGIAVGALLANLSAHASPATAAGIAAGNTLEAVVGAALLRRAGVRPDLTRLGDVAGFVVLAAGASTIVSATIGVVSLCTSGLQPWSKFPALWSVWWIGDAIGDVVMAPFLLAWATRRRPRVTPTGVADAVVKPPDLERLTELLGRVATSTAEMRPRTLH